MQCMMPLAASSQGHWPDWGKECSGWSSQIGERLHPLLFNYLIIVFFFLIIVSFCESGGGGMDGRFILYYAGSRNTAVRRSNGRRREWRGSAVAGPESKSPHQQWRPRQSEMESYAIPKREEYEGGPRRAAERKEGPQVGEGPRGGCRFGLASRADPASEEIQSSQQDLRAA